MLDDKGILAVVPARGGSKGVRLKNIHPLAGRPLIAHTADVIRQLAYVDRAVVSTDHPEIAAAARRCGLAVPFTRPSALSGDRVGDWDVLHHALLEMEAQDGTQYDVLVMLQPTCPLRKAEHVTAAVQALVQGGWDAVWTVSVTDLKYHPLKQLCIEEDGRLTYFDRRGSAIIARQQLAPTYTRNGAAYAVTRQCLIEERTILGKRSSAVVICDPLVSIDTLDDFVRVERRMLGSTAAA